MEYNIDDRVAAINISVACVDPRDVVFDLWHRVTEDFIVEHVSVVHALENHLIDLQMAVGIMHAACMRWVVCRNCTDVRGYVVYREAVRDVDDDPRFEPVILSIRDYLCTFFDV